MIDYKFRDFDEARRSPADIAMGLLEEGEIRLYRNQLGTITARWQSVPEGRRPVSTDHATITEALAALEASVNERGDYAER